MLAKLYKLRPLRKQTKKTVAGYRNEQQVEIFGHLFGKSAINFYHTCQW